MAKPSDQGSVGLVLTRTKGQKLVIVCGDGSVVELTLVNCVRNVRIGILAPNKVKVFRKELLQKAQEDGKGEVSIRS